MIQHRSGVNCIRMAQSGDQHTDTQKCPITATSKIVTVPIESHTLVPVITMTTTTATPTNNNVVLLQQPQNTKMNASNSSPTTTHSAMTLDLSAAATLLDITSSTAAITPVTPECQSLLAQGKSFDLISVTTETQPTLKYVFTLAQRGASKPVTSTPSEHSSPTEVDVPDLSSTSKSVQPLNSESSPTKVETPTSNGSHGHSTPDISNTQPVILTSFNFSSPLSRINIKDGVPKTFSTDEIEAFAKSFKQQRIALGFTQEEVGLALGTLYGNMYSQTTICRFEVLQLSFKKMCQLKPLLERWLEDATEKVGDGGVRKRKKRMSIDATMKAVFESHYAVEKKPRSEEIARIAADVQVDKEVVRVWFCNRRQKERKMVKKATEVPEDLGKNLKSSELLPVKQEPHPLEDADNDLKQNCQKLLSFINREVKS